jgi:hypothetical protein
MGQAFLCHLSISRRVNHYAGFVYSFWRSHGSAIYVISRFLGWHSGNAFRASAIHMDIAGSFACDLLDSHGCIIDLRNAQSHPSSSSRLCPAPPSANVSSDSFSGRVNRCLEWALRRRIYPGRPSSVCIYIGRSNIPDIFGSLLHLGHIRALAVAIP